MYISASEAAQTESSGEQQNEIPHHRGRSLDPVLILLGAMLLAIALTWIIPSGAYQRVSAAENAPVIAGSYRQMPKSLGMENLAPGETRPGIAHPVSPLALVTSVPQGLAKSTPVIFMMLLIGGMFGILRSSGALEAGISRLLALSGGRSIVLVPLLMIAFSAGSTFLGMVTEYLPLIPIVILLGRKIGRSAMIGFALITLAAKIGYIASVTNPYALLIAQPIAGVPVFSGIGMRLGVWIVFLTIAVVMVLRTGQDTRDRSAMQAQSLTARQIGVLSIAIGTLAVIAYGSISRGWKDTEFSAAFVSASILMTIVSGIKAGAATQHFVKGMHTMVLASLLVGLGRSVELILREGMVLDTIINAMSHIINGWNPLFVAPTVMAFEMLLTLLIPSTSAKAALSMPILVPVAASCGVSAQATVLAFLLGNGLVNMFAPTSGMLLAFLAAADIPYTQWFRFVLPLFLVLSGLSVGVVMLAVVIGY